MGSPRSLSIGALQGSRDSPSDGWRLRQNRDGSTAYVDQDTVWPKSTWLISRSSAVSFLNESLRKIKKVLLIDSLACLFMSISDWKEIRASSYPLFWSWKHKAAIVVTSCYFFLLLESNILCHLAWVTVPATPCEVIGYAHALTQFWSCKCKRFLPSSTAI